MKKLNISKINVETDRSEEKHEDFGKDESNIQNSFKCSS